MITRRRILAASGGAAALVAAATPAGAQGRKEPMKITRSNSQPSRMGPAEHFTGSVRVDTPFRANAPARAGGAFVTFEPGARTAWHSHPLGQTLIITMGCGWVQTEGGPREEVLPGDVVSFPPGVKHWHGAAANSALSHAAVIERVDMTDVTWMEQVSDDQYGGVCPT